MSTSKQQSFMKLYEPVHERFEKFCKARVYGDFEFKDLMHETIIIAYNKFDQVTEDKSFLFFLFGICRRILANNHRKISSINWDDSKEITSEFSINEGQKKLEVDDLHKALSQLPENQREAIILYEITGFSVKEIAELQNAGESAVKQRLARGRKQLLELLTEKTVA